MEQFTNEQTPQTTIGPEVKLILYRLLSMFPFSKNNTLLTMNKTTFNFFFNLSMQRLEEIYIYLKTYDTPNITLRQKDMLLEVTNAIRQLKVLINNLPMLTDSIVFKQLKKISQPILSDYLLHEPNNPLAIYYSIMYSEVPHKINMILSSCKNILFGIKITNQLYTYLLSQGEIHDFFYELLSNHQQESGNFQYISYFIFHNYLDETFKASLISFYHPPTFAQKEEEHYFIFVSQYVNLINNYHTLSDIVILNSLKKLHQISSETLEECVFTFSKHHLLAIYYTIISTKPIALLQKIEPFLNSNAIKLKCIQILSAYAYNTNTLQNYIEIMVAIERKITQSDAKKMVKSVSSAYELFPTITDTDAIKTTSSTDPFRKTDPSNTPVNVTQSTQTNVWHHEKTKTILTHPFPSTKTANPKINALLRIYWTLPPKSVFETIANLKLAIDILNLENNPDLKSLQEYALISVSSFKYIISMYIPTLLNHIQRIYFIEKLIIYSQLHKKYEELLTELFSSTYNPIQIILSIRLDLFYHHFNQKERKWAKNRFGLPIHTDLDIDPFEKNSVQKKNIQCSLFYSKLPSTSGKRPFNSL